MIKYYKPADRNHRQRSLLLLPVRVLRALLRLRVAIVLDWLFAISPYAAAFKTATSLVRSTHN